MISALRRAWRMASRTSTGWCVRLDWPDGTHDLVCYRADPRAARRAADDVRRFWSRTVRLHRSSVVAISRHDWRLHRHRRGCRAPDCPTAADLPAQRDRRR